MAAIGWIDFSRKDRNRVSSILDLLRPEGQVDELGIGTLRDGLANSLFPGISTIQTRAKYFFIIPYILQDFLQLPVTDRKKKMPTYYLENEEYEVMWDLADKYNHQEGHGVIGISKYRARKEKIARRPSEIYWNGLNVMKCLDSKGLSAAAFLNKANKNNQETLIHYKTVDGEGDDKDAGFYNYFNIKVPINKNWKTNLDLNLTTIEAEFLRDNMIDIKDSVLSLVVSNENIYSEFNTTDKFIDFARISYSEISNEQLKSNVILAHDFAILMQGAHIAYNQELQKQFCEADCFEENWNKWYDSFEQNMINYQAFNVEDLFVHANTTRAYTRDFVRDWFKLLKAETLDLQKKAELIRNQEWRAKNKKARLKYNKKDKIEEGKAIGLGLLDFRFRSAKIIVKDIKEGLKNA
ncbi:DUF6361 family protein [Bizionia arctica]|uniref:Uncharacterized protein n=1 Tax=Bizionia arctica TaxID=1495645 RepID=A0A917GMB7_9FLAO|nr:DUF6361 family protein [Bizionia arctica]GGG51683.1 hypothetical protein GCM10010976_23580 [Bizionia arctica]